MFPFNRSAKRPEWGMPHACVLHRVYWFEIMIISLIMSWSTGHCGFIALTLCRSSGWWPGWSWPVRHSGVLGSHLGTVYSLSIITICFEGRAESLCRQQYIPGSGRQLDVTLIVPPQMYWIPLYPDTGVNNMMKRGSKRFSGLLQHWRLWVLNWSWSKRESITGTPQQDMLQGTGRTHWQPSCEIPAKETQDTFTQQHWKRCRLEKHAHRKNQQDNKTCWKQKRKKE